jgi:iron-sulfur cluster assembly accessory protein
MFVLNLTPAAKEKINELCNVEPKHFGVHLGLKGGGCAGFEYEWSMCNKEDVGVNDEIINAGDGNLVVDAVSLMYLFGCEVDYVKDVFQTQFVINNPNAQSACGCGVSVNFDLDKVEENNGKIVELT